MRKIFVIYFADLIFFKSLRYLLTSPLHMLYIRAFNHNIYQYTILFLMTQCWTTLNYNCRLTN